MLLVTGHTILGLEPTLPHTGYSPDFFVAAPDGTKFYLEAVVVTAKSKAEAAAEKRLNAAIAAIERIPCPDHFLDLNVEGKPTRPISLKDLRKRLLLWISQLPESGSARVPEPFVYEAFGAKFTIGAFRRSHQAKLGERSIGLQSMEARWIRPGHDIRASLEKKASKYGELDAPYVVAVNTTGEYHDEEDAVAALIGTPAEVVRRYPDGRTEHHSSRNADGVWWGKDGPRNTGLSAVLSTERLSPWSLAQRRARIIYNPWATQPISDIPLNVDALRPSEGRFVKSEGVRIGALLGLHEDWPEEPPT